MRKYVLLKNLRISFKIEVRTVEQKFFADTVGRRGFDTMDIWAHVGRQIWNAWFFFFLVPLYKKKQVLRNLVQHLT